MSLENQKLGAGGTGFQGVGSGSAAGAIAELQGLNVTLLAGTTADTKIEVAAIRSEDTIVSCLENAAGTFTDRTATTTINTLYASGTLTANTIIAGSEVAVAGQSYVFQAAAPTGYGQVEVGADDDGSIANLKAAINLYESSIERGGAQVVATNATNVCTVTASAEGAVGNAIALTTEDASVAVSAATLTGGTDTGGVQCSDITTGDQLVLIWFDKNA